MYNTIRRRVLLFLSQHVAMLFGLLLLLSKSFRLVSQAVFKLAPRCLFTRVPSQSGRILFEPVLTQVPSCSNAHCKPLSIYTFGWQLDPWTRNVLRPFSNMPDRKLRTFLTRNTLTYVLNVILFITKEILYGTKN